jgi:uncharacterized protein (DUF608 family)
MALAGAAAAIGPLGGEAFADEAASGSDIIPEDKNLSSAWLSSLTERGLPAVYSGQDLKTIGMPVGGLCAGQLYLGGDGKLWRWNIFNTSMGGSGYVQPPPRDIPIEQGFSLTFETLNGAQTLSLDNAGFTNITFRGQYPIGFVDYEDPKCPLTVSLRVFSPFIPLDFDRSSFPATILRYTIKNPSSQTVKGTIAGWLQNPVCQFTASQVIGQRRNTVVRQEKATVLTCDLVTDKSSQSSSPDIVFEDWNKSTYSGWTEEGTAFGSGPIKKSDMPQYQGDVGGDTDRVVNSHATSKGTVEQRDSETGKLTCAPFQITRKFIRVWIGGGANPGKTCLNLVVDGVVVGSLTGANNNQMSLAIMDTSKFVGKSGVIEIVDSATGPWGNIGVGSIKFTDVPGQVDLLPDFGNMALALLGEPAQLTATTGGAAALSPGLAQPGVNDISKPLSGCLARTLELHPGESQNVDFVIAWSFPNLHLDGLGNVGHHYASRFKTSSDTVAAIAGEFDYLLKTTELWRATWYDSSLPYWFLDRTFANIVMVASTATYRFTDGRFYSWEGVGCCQGTCTHVWHYAQAFARLFPEIERDTRHRVDLDIGFNTSTGVIGFRAEFDRGLAVDGQAGTILRFYREHQMSVDDTFLKSNWPRIKQSFDPLLALDVNKDGILEGAQMNTLDQPWYGQNAWQSSMYVAALRAGEAMASEVGDADFKSLCASTAEAGTRNITERLFDGEYFYDRVDPTRLDITNAGTGCHIDQVLGQSWAHQVGLPRVLPEKETVSALKSLWKYNFAPDVGPYRKANPPGRWFAVAGEAGMIMTTFPRAGWNYENAKGSGPEWATGYFNECMSGFEHQVAGHMIAEGLLTEGLAVERAIHDRYHPSKRNPYNEVECGDHYSRAMASYGVFLTACGFQYHGPKRTLEFAPRIKPDNAKFAFTTAAGWGSCAQRITNGKFTASVSIKYGHANIETLTLSPPDAAAGKNTLVKLNGKKLTVAAVKADGKLIVKLPAGTIIHAGQSLTIET